MNLWPSSNLWGTPGGHMDPVENDWSTVSIVRMETKWRQWLLWAIKSFPTYVDPGRVFEVVRCLRSGLPLQPDLTRRTPSQIGFLNPNTILCPLHHTGSQTEMDEDSENDMSKWKKHNSHNEHSTEICGSAFHSVSEVVECNPQKPRSKDSASVKSEGHNIFLCLLYACYFLNTWCLFCILFDNCTVTEVNRWTQLSTHKASCVHNICLSI